MERPIQFNVPESGGFDMILIKMRAANDLESTLVLVVELNKFLG
jgi:hypothetical protein